MAEGANVDLGLGQINGHNLKPLGLSVADAFDPCRNLAGIARLIAPDYDRADPQPGAEQAALRTSLSFYNTGTAWRGFANGYVAKVAAAAGQIVPALQPDERNTSGPARAEPSRPVAVWDVFGDVSAPAVGFVFTPASGDNP
jgi:type IV secretion system protein VirB1